MNQPAQSDSEWAGVGLPSRAAPVILTVVLVLLSIWLHFEGRTSITQDDEIWSQRVDVIASTYDTLKTRYFTTYSIKALNSVFHLRYVTSFILLQFSLLLVLAWVFWLYLKQLGFGRLWSNVGLGMLLLSYPILAAHFQPVHTWDDFWQYIAITGALVLLLKGELLPSSLVFAIGVVARESTMILYPSYVLATLYLSPRRDRWTFATLLIPVIVLISYQSLVFEAPPDERFLNFQKNFKNLDFVRNTVYSLLVSFGSLWLFSFASILTTDSDARPGHFTWLKWCLVYSVPITVLLTLTLGLARETRLFFPPFVFVIPLSIYFIRENLGCLRDFYLKGSGIPGIAMVAISSWASWAMCKTMFPSFDFRAWLTFSQVYLTIHSTIAVGIIFPIIYAGFRRLVSRGTAESQISGV